MICSDTVEQREKPLWPSCCPCSRATSRASTRPWRAAPSPSVSWIPLCTSSFPPRRHDIELLAKDSWARPLSDIKAIIASLHEFNPMMGHRGCRLAVTFPEIAVMQTRAVIRAAINVQKTHPDWNMVPEIMIPLVGEVKELKYVKDVVVKAADEEHRGRRYRT